MLSLPGKQAEVLNILVEDVMQGHPVSEQRLKEVLGHNPLEVGLCVSFLTDGEVAARDVQWEPPWQLVTSTLRNCKSEARATGTHTAVMFALTLLGNVSMHVVFFAITIVLSQGWCVVQVIAGSILGVVIGMLTPVPPAIVL